MVDPTPPNPTQILSELRNGDSSAADRLLPVVYDRLRELAEGYFRNQATPHTLQPTALVHEAFIRLINQKSATPEDRKHFIALCATAMRDILTDHARRRRAVKRGGDKQRVNLTGVLAGSEEADVDALDLDSALTVLNDLNSRQARIVELRFFGGLTMEEVAQYLEVSLTTVEGDWRMARAWLSAYLTDDGS